MIKHEIIQWDNGEVSICISAQEVLKMDARSYNAELNGFDVERLCLSLFNDEFASCYKLIGVFIQGTNTTLCPQIIYRVKPKTESEKYHYESEKYRDCVEFLLEGLPTFDNRSFIPKEKKQQIVNQLDDYIGTYSAMPYSKINEAAINSFKTIRRTLV